jgi:predicted ATPase
VIASIAFRRFKALRNTQVELRPFNLVIGPNGSGKTSLIEAILQLRSLARLGPVDPAVMQAAEGPRIEFRFSPPHDGVTVRLGCVSDALCDLLQVEPAGAAGWTALRDEIAGARGFVLEHAAMAPPSPRTSGAQLARDGGNIAAVLARMRETAPDSFSALTAELLRVLPEFHSLELVEHADDKVEAGLRLAEGGFLPVSELSQGMAYLIAILALGFAPSPPPVVCIEEVDRGIHPRTLREIRDALYRLSYPESFGLTRGPVQVVATTHSPYLIDQFREHPDEIVISQKRGRAAHFERLSDRQDLPELMKEGSLGDMWFSGILGGVPEED